MKLSDFHKGQTVYLHGGFDRHDFKIHETTVTSVGRKYVTVRYLGGIKFDATKDFREVTQYTPHFTLHLTREEIEEQLERSKKREKVEQAFRWENRLCEKMSDDDLDKIIEIINKYQDKKEG